MQTGKQGLGKRMFWCQWVIQVEQGVTLTNEMTMTDGHRAHMPGDPSTSMNEDNGGFLHITGKILQTLIGQAAISLLTGMKPLIRQFHAIVEQISTRTARHT